MVRRYCLDVFQSWLLIRFNDLTLARLSPLCRIADRLAPAVQERFGNFHGLGLGRRGAKTRCQPDGPPHGGQGVGERRLRLGVPSPRRCD